MFAHGEIVTRLRAPLITDPYSAEATKPDWPNAASTPIAGCAVADGGSSEPLEVGRASVVSDFDVYAPAGSGVLSTDRLIVRGLTCEVVARPFDWRSPFTGWAPGVVIKVKIAEG